MTQIGRMHLRSGLGRVRRLAGVPRVCCIFLLLAILTITATAALPKRLVLAIDGISYRDAKALQQGLTYTFKGTQVHTQCFHDFFPASRMVSSFPSASDVAWTEMLGDRPLPGYQRTYFCNAANRQIWQNGVTTSMEYERQMSWQENDNYRRAMGYITPEKIFRNELRDVVDHFFQSTEGDVFYGFIRSSDDAQHMAADIISMLCLVDDTLRQVRARYLAREGRDLEILILSDHGNNGAGRGRRVPIRSFLKKSGYRLSHSIQGPRDVVLPTVGIESWVEIHNAPCQTEALIELLCDLEGVDVLTAVVPGATNRFVVLNSRRERALIETHPMNGSLRYVMLTGDPLNYRQVVEALAQDRQLDPQGFASAEAWMSHTFSHRYPVALERIVRAQTRLTLNPATIIISLDNRYVHASWLVKRGSELVRFGGTHGGLDGLNSNGVLLSNFAPTQDTCTTRVAALFDGFPGLRNYHALETGAEWVSARAQALASIARTPLDRIQHLLPKDQVCLRVWTPEFSGLRPQDPIEITVKKSRTFLTPRIRRTDPEPDRPAEHRLILQAASFFSEISAYERLYLLPSDVAFEPHQQCEISGRVPGRKQKPLFSFSFYTEGRGKPVAY